MYKAALSAGCWWREWGYHCVWSGLKSRDLQEAIRTKRYVHEYINVKDQRLKCQAETETKTKIHKKGDFYFI